MKRITGTLQCLAIAAIVIVGGCSGENKTEQTVEQTVVETALAVKGEEIVTVSRELRSSFTGSLEGKKQAVIRAKIAEAVEKILVREGDRVTPSDVLLRLDRTGPTSNYVQAFSVFKNAEKNYSKMKYLFGEGAISESEYDGAATEYEVAKANYEAASQLVDIRSPVSGTVTSIDVAPGEYVMVGQQVATVAATDTLRMKLGVTSADVRHFTVGVPVEIFMETMPNVIGYGRVSMVAGSADPETRAFQVELLIDNSEGRFKPGMFARAEITLAKYRDVITVAHKTMLERSGDRYVFVVNGDRAILRKVITGVEFDAFTQIVAGLKPGDTVITVGQDYLEDSTKINMVRFVNARGEEIEL
ncbi:MAG: efflux RND transporter periplasmic adaptor subunit [candidate division Zixibacteria bacterium]|nr:efflux RND transporter periplasmic adaptor subunit [candidate division Zixibacteria bacterium]